MFFKTMAAREQPMMILKMSASLVMRFQDIFIDFSAQVSNLQR